MPITPADYRFGPNARNRLADKAMTFTDAVT
jgi:hypothetical protein